MFGAPPVDFLPQQDPVAYEQLLKNAEHFITDRFLPKLGSVQPDPVVHIVKASPRCPRRPRHAAGRGAPASLEAAHVRRSDGAAARGPLAVCELGRGVLELARRVSARQPGPCGGGPLQQCVKPGLAAASLVGPWSDAARDSSLPCAGRAHCHWNAVATKEGRLSGCATNRCALYGVSRSPIRSRSGPLRAQQ